jgi:hypothetical protein
MIPLAHCAQRRDHAGGRVLPRLDPLPIPHQGLNAAIARFRRSFLVSLCRFLSARDKCGRKDGGRLRKPFKRTTPHDYTQFRAL